jgi:hypothetical protein
MFGCQWFMLGYLTRLPHGLALRIWDLFFLEGYDVFFGVALAVMHHHRGACIHVEWRSLAHDAQRRCWPASLRTVLCVSSAPRYTAVSSTSIAALTHERVYAQDLRVDADAFMQLVVGELAFVRRSGRIA